MHPETRPRSPTPDAGTGFVFLDDLGVLRFEGGDASGFLQGYLTTDTADLGAAPQFTAICNLKGRAVCTGRAWLEGGSVMLILHRSLCPVVLEFLRPYLAFSKTQASELPSGVVGVLGAAPQSHKLDRIQGGRIDVDRRLFAVDDKTARGMLEVGPMLARAAWDERLIERREVWIEAATSGRFLPQMLALDECGAVSFTKGCYLGQEVVARAQHRGQVKRKLAALSWDGARPATGSPIEANGREVGAVVAVAGNGTTGHALAVLVAGQAEHCSSNDAGTSFHPLA